jgi:hypothetical protein
LSSLAQRGYCVPVANKPALQIGRLGEVQQVIGQPVQHGHGKRANALLVLPRQHAQAPCQQPLNSGSASDKLALQHAFR